MTSAYRAPWTNGAYAYPQADSLEAMWEGVARKRKPLTVHVSHVSVGDLPCAHCGEPLGGAYPINPDDPREDWKVDKLGYAYVNVDPKRKIAAARHYYCAWASTMARVLELGRAIYG